MAGRQERKKAHGSRRDRRECSQSTDELSPNGDPAIRIDRELIRKCLSSECSGCRENCPSYQAFQLDSYASRGKNRALEAYLKGDLTLDTIRELIYACTNCGQCAEVCLTGGAFSEQVLALREQLECRGEENPGLREMVEYIRERSTPYGSKDTSWIPTVASSGEISGKASRKGSEKASRRGSEKALRRGSEKALRRGSEKVSRIGSVKATGKESGGAGGSLTRPFRKGRIGYFPGCTIQAENPEFAKRTMRLISALGTDPVPLSHPCCGFPVLNAGFTVEARELSLAFLEEVREKRIKTIITSCAGCTAMLRNQLPHLTNERVDVKHITEFLSEKRKKVSELYGSVGRGKAVLYHDPCDLARKLGVMDEPRKVIRSLGFELLEFHDNRMETTCCGGGGGFARDYPDIAVGVSKIRIQEAIGDTKDRTKDRSKEGPHEQLCDTIVTACLSCRRMLRSAAEKDMTVVDIIELFPEKL